MIIRFLFFLIELNYFVIKQLMRLDFRVVDDN